MCDERISVPQFDLVRLGQRLRLAAEIAVGDHHCLVAAVILFGGDGLLHGFDADAALVALGLNHRFLRPPSQHQVGPKVALVGGALYLIAELLEKNREILLELLAIKFVDVGDPRLGIAARL